MPYDVFLYASAAIALALMILSVLTPGPKRRE